MPFFSPRDESGRQGTVFKLREQTVQSLRTNDAQESWIIDYGEGIRESKSRLESSG